MTERDDHPSGVAADQAARDFFPGRRRGPASRRDVLARLAAATALLPVLENDRARAAVTREDDRRLAIDTARFDVDTIDFIEPERIGSRRAPNFGVVPTRVLPFMTSYRARLAAPTDAPSPAVIVVHDEQGLDPHAEDVARRLALEGFTAYAIDVLSSYGGTPDDAEDARETVGKLDPAKTVARYAEIVASLARRRTHNGRVGAVGFGWGGGVVGRLVADAPGLDALGLDAGVAYYAAPPPGGAAAGAPLLLHYAGRDRRANAGVAAYRANLDAAGARYELHVYEGARRGFDDDEDRARHNRAAARLAWSRTIAFLKRELAV